MTYERKQTPKNVDMVQFKSSHLAVFAHEDLATSH